MNEIGNIIYADKVDLYIHEYYSRFCKDADGIDAYILSSPQNTWHGCMGYIYDHVIGAIGLKDAHGIYIIDRLEEALKLYIELCGMYDKVITVVGYSRLCGIWNVDIYYILENCGIPRIMGESGKYKGGYSRELSSRYLAILETLKGGREASTAAKLTATKGNMLGLLAIQNHYHQWNAPGISYDDTRRAALAASELPRLDGAGGATTAPLLPDGGTGSGPDGVPDGGM